MNDTPGVTYTAVRGAFDFLAHFEKKKRRSLYGVRRPDTVKRHVRRNLRKGLAEQLASEKK
jgi:hypothetical protein